MSKDMKLIMENFRSFSEKTKNEASISGRKFDQDGDGHLGHQAVQAMADQLKANEKGADGEQSEGQFTPADSEELGSIVKNNQGDTSGLVSSIYEFLDSPKGHAAAAGNFDRQKIGNVALMNFKTHIKDAIFAIDKALGGYDLDTGEDRPVGDFSIDEHKKLMACRYALGELLAVVVGDQESFDMDKSLVKGGARYAYGKTAKQHKPRYHDTPSNFEYGDFDAGQEFSDGRKAPFEE